MQADPRPDQSRWVSPITAEAPPRPAPLAPLAALLPLLTLISVCWLAFFNGLGSLGLMDKTEALFVEVAHQMVLRHDWVTPWWNGQTFFDYPVWGYWMVAQGFRLFGPTEWAARLPVALAATATVMAACGLVYLWGSTLEAPRTRLIRACVAAGVLATTPGWIGWGRTATTDMFLASAISLALFGFLISHRLAGHRLWEPMGRIALALFSGIAVLAKGPVGLLLPVLVIAAFLTWRGHWQRWARPFPMLAMALLFLGVVLPWYGAATAANGGAFLNGFLGFSNLKRFTSVLYAHPGPPWFYLPWLLLLLLPWTFFLPAALIGRGRWWSPSQSAGPGPFADELQLFLVLWLGLVLAFFSAAATKLPGYILPALPAASLLVGLYWRPWPAQGQQRGRRPGAPAPRGSSSWPVSAAGWIQTALLGGLALASLQAPHWAATDPAYPHLGAALASSGLPPRLAILLAAMALASAWLLLRGQGRWLYLPNLVGFAGLLALVIAPLGPLLDRERQAPPRQLALEARRLARPDEPLWVVGSKRYSTLFYGGETARFVSGHDEVHDRLKEFEPGADGPSQRPSSIRLLGDRRQLEQLRLSDAAVERLARRGEQELWRLTPPRAVNP
ncbi:MAG: glycosyltransferase family 39 protein [Cyanobacteria bacterium]|nr:glycosyltransferase family 39 protein [Cyanobacteriota bacterium]